jgi:hypothetical protein
MSKAKGMWMGGMIPLGYDVVDRLLVINPVEAELVRRIFSRYLELGSVHLLRDELEAEGVRSKSWVARSGKPMGGAIFNRGGIFHLLRNRLYAGEIRHKGDHHLGLHQGLIEKTLFEAIQRQLDANAVAHRKQPARNAAAVLSGRIFDADGAPMSPTFSYGRAGRRYRYYVSCDLQQGRKAAPVSAIGRVRGDAVEEFLVSTLSRLTRRPLVVHHLSQLVRRVELRSEEAHVLVDGAALAPERHTATMLAWANASLTLGEVAVWEDEAASLIRLILPKRLKLRGGRVWIDGAEATCGPAPNAMLVAALRSSHAELAELRASPLTDVRDLLLSKAPLTRHRQQLARLAFLAPALQRAVLEGAPTHLRLGDLAEDVPLAWSDQLGWLSKLAAR